MVFTASVLIIQQKEDSSASFLHLYQQHQFLQLIGSILLFLLLAIVCCSRFRIHVASGPQSLPWMSPPCTFIFPSSLIFPRPCACMGKTHLWNRPPICWELGEKPIFYWELKFALFFRTGKRILGIMSWDVLLVKTGIAVVLKQTNWGTISPLRNKQTNVEAFFFFLPQSGGCTLNCSRPLSVFYHPVLKVFF